MYQCGSCRATFPYKPKRCPKCGITFIGEEQVDRLKPSFADEARQQAEERELQTALRAFLGWALLWLLLIGGGWLAYLAVRIEFTEGWLREAALKGDVAKVKRYLDFHWGPFRANIDKAGLACASPNECYGMTPLMAAARFGHGPVVALLLERGANPSIKSSDGYTAAGLARKFGHPKVAELLQSRPRQTH